MSAGWFLLAGVGFSIWAQYYLSHSLFIPFLLGIRESAVAQVPLCRCLLQASFAFSVSHSCNATALTTLPGSRDKARGEIRTRGARQ